MAWVAHVGVNSAVGAVCSSSLLGSLVNLDVFDDEVSGVEAFGVGVGFGVLQKGEKEFGGFDWVAGTGDSELLAWRDVSAKTRGLCIR